MSSFDIFLLSVALAMDCFAVSVVSGVLLRRMVWRVLLQMSFLFGLFQAAMPLAGWLCTMRLSGVIEAYDHWVAFAMLAFIGGKMIYESFSDAGSESFNPRRLRTQLLLSVATSIDALAIGISFAMTGYDTLSSLFFPLVCIGVVSFLAGISGQLLGIRFGLVISRRLRPELVGGIILVCIGLKILISHLAE